MLAQKELTSTTAPTTVGKRQPNYLVPAICFVVALIASLLNNFYGQESKTVLIFDSRHYLETARLMVVWWQESVAKGDLLSALTNLSHSQPWFAEYLILDGPVLPAMAAIVFTVLGKVPQQTDWRILVALFSVLQAASALMVGVLMQRWVKSAKWGLLAGLSWALYPAAIVASGRFLTETPAVTLLLVGVLSLDVLVEKSSQVLKSTFKSCAAPTLVNGLANGLLFLLKPVLVPMWGVAYLLAWLSCNWKKRIVMVSMLLCGAGAILLPWLVTTRLVTGEMQLLPQRVPAYNVAKGCDVEVDGWGVVPSVPLTDIFASEKSSIDAALGVWTTRPLESVNLILRKTTRMWSWPWNDFRQHPLMLSMDVQRWWHWTFCLAALGGCFVLLTGKPFNKVHDFVGLASLSIVFAHLVYLPFETITRYGFTAMPFMILLAVYFIHALARLGKLPRAVLTLSIPILAVCALLGNNLGPQLVQLGLESGAAHGVQMFLIWLSVCWLMISAAGLTAGLSPRHKHRAVITLLVIGCVVSGSVLASFALNNKEALSWSCRLEPGQAVCRAIDLSSAHLRSVNNLGGALILIDGDSTIENAKLTINGQVLNEKPVTVWQFRPDYYWVYDLMRKYAGTIGFQLDDLRRWYAVSVPLSYLHLSGGNVVVLSAVEKPVTVFGEYSRGSEGQFLKDFDRFSPGKFCNDGDLMDGRVSQPISKRFVPSVSSLEAGGYGTYDDLSPTAGKQTGEYHIYLATFLKPDVTGADAGNGARYVRALCAHNFDALLRVPSEGQELIGVSKPQFQCAANNTVEVTVPQYLNQGSHIIVSIAGKMRSADKLSKFSILPAVVGGKNGTFVMVLPHTPSCIQASSQWQDFEIKEELPVAAMQQGGLQKLQIGLYPGPWEQVAEYGVVGSYGQTLLKDLSVTLTVNNRKNFSGKVPVVF